MIDDYASDPTKEKCKQEAYEIIVVHLYSSKVLENYHQQSFATDNAFSLLIIDIITCFRLNVNTLNQIKI